MKSIILTGLALLMLAPSAFSMSSQPKHECKKLTPTSMDQLADGKKVHVIFFASWCPGCRDHLLMKHKEPTIMVNVWDKPGRGAEALKFTKVDTSKFPCFIDDKEILAKGLKVPELPFAADVNSKKLKAVVAASKSE